jgi:hypothetical protein
VLTTDRTALLARHARRCYIVFAYWRNGAAVPGSVIVLRSPSRVSSFLLVRNRVCPGSRSALGKLTTLKPRLCRKLMALSGTHLNKLLCSSKDYDLLELATLPQFSCHLSCRRFKRFSRTRFAVCTNACSPRFGVGQLTSNTFGKSIIHSALAALRTKSRGNAGMLGS